MKVLQILFVFSLVALFTLTLTSCGEKSVSPEDDVVIVDDDLYDDGDTDDENQDNDNNDDQLNFYEENLLGLWSRYHSYDGSTMYIYFNADRTACKWEEESGSDYRRSRRSYSHWYIDDTDVEGGVVTVVMDNGSFTYQFDYPADEIWPLSYTNLTYYPSSSGKSCDE